LKTTINVISNIQPSQKIKKMIAQIRRKSKEKKENSKRKEANILGM
jgi:hypothetical protein